jgi:hypothetical protein
MYENGGINAQTTTDRDTSQMCDKLCYIPHMKPQVLHVYF